MPMVFSRQVDRWWEFLKWQIDNRGTPVGYDGFSAFFEAQKRRYTLLGSHAMVSNSTFEETVRRQWGLRPKLLEVPSNADFLAGGQETSRILQLHSGVLADRLAASLKALELRYRNAWDSLRRLDTPQPSALGRVALSSSKASSADAPCLEQQLATTQAELEALRQKIDDCWALSTCGGGRSPSKHPDAMGSRTGKVNKKRRRAETKDIPVERQFKSEGTLREAQLNTQLKEGQKAPAKPRHLSPPPQQSRTGIASMLC
ncbi:hypothetical protein V8E54_012578 [Elaphomyces granulatus]